MADSSAPIDADIRSDASRDDCLEAAARGDAHAWAELVKRYSPRVFALMLKRCRDRELAEELTQDAFVRIVSKLSSYQERGKFEAWLFRIAMNRLRDEMRRRGRQAVAVGGQPDQQHGDDSGIARQADPDAVDPLDQMARQEQIAQLREAMDQLSEADQEVLYLHHTAGLTFAQIAESLEQPLGTVLARGHRALKKLRQILENAALAQQ